MSPRRRRDLAMPDKALLNDPDLVGIAPVPPPQHILGGQDFNLRSELTVGHKVGRITGARTPSGGPHRKDTSCRRSQRRKDCHDRRDLPESTSLKVHFGVLKKGGRGRLIGRTKVGMNTKLHAICDRQGRRLNLFVTAGQVSGLIEAAPFLAPCGTSIGHSRSVAMMPIGSEKFCNIKGYVHAS